MQVLRGRQSHRRLFAYVVVSLATTFSLLMISQAIYPKSASAAPASYSCGDPGQNNHCYAFYQWTGGVDGAETNINVPFLGGGQSTDGFTDWEMWVAQEGCGSGGCWVEAGITTDASHPETYFWATQRPDGSYNDYFPQQVGPDDQIETFQIYKQDNYTWNVSGSVASCGGGQKGHCSPSWSDQSGSNNMSPNVIQIGIELAGTYGQQLVGSDWQFNDYRCGNNWCKQSGLGGAGSGYSGDLGVKTGPLSGHWNHEPDSSGNSGDWYAS